MQNDHIHRNANPGRSINAYQNEDANAIAIDLMLANLKILLKKTLLLKKLLKQLSERKEPLQQNQSNQKTSYINEQTNNLPLVFDKTIPPDKRMTNLFYMRIIKQIAYYEKIIPSFTQIRPKLEQCYSQQVNSEQFSIVELYLLCERKFIFQIKLIKNKSLQILKDQNNNFLINQNNLELDLIGNKIQIGKASLSEKTAPDVKNYFNIGNIQCSNNNFFLKQPMVTEGPAKKPIQKCYKTLQQAIKSSSKCQLHLDFKQRTSQIIDKIYSPLDIQTVEIITYFIPTLMPEDNIDFIYQKVKQRSKKTRKQIRQFQTEHALFVLKRQQHFKKRLRKQQSRRRIDSFVKEQRLPLKILSRESAQIQPEKPKLLLSKKHSLPSVQTQKPITANGQVPLRERNVSRFRQKFEESLENSKQSSSGLLKFNTLNPLVVNQQNSRIPIKLIKKKVLDESNSSFKEKENNSLHEPKGIKKVNSLNKTEKTQTKVSRFGQRRGRSLKNNSNKEIKSKKLKL